MGRICPFGPATDRFTGRRSQFALAEFAVLLAGGFALPVRTP